MNSQMIVVAIFALLWSSDVAAFFRLECLSSYMGRIDPLLAPGLPSQHVHSIKGGSGFSANTTTDDLLNSKCTSCGVAQDMSAYWHPALYFLHDDGTLEVVPEKPPHKSYYLFNDGLTHDGRQQTVEAFPNGFRMIAGSNSRRNGSAIPSPDPKPLGPWPEASQTERAQRALGFNCLHYKEGVPNEASLMRYSLPTKDFLDAHCKDGLRLELQFPSCWDGNMTGGPTHNEHVAYPDGVMTGNCPPGYDRRLVTLFYETIMATDKYRGVSGKFVLANGDPTGYGYHGDVIIAWKDNTLAKAVKTCTDISGQMRDCPLFTFTQNSESCQMDKPLLPAIANENVKGPMHGLANGLPIWYGPAPMPAVPEKTGAAAQPVKPNEPLSDVAQNLVPTAPAPVIPAAIASHLAAKPSIGSISEKAAQEIHNAAGPVKYVVGFKGADGQDSLAYNLPAAAPPLLEPEATVTLSPPYTPTVVPKLRYSSGVRPLTTKFWREGGNDYEEIILVLSETTTVTQDFAVPSNAVTV